MAAADGCCFLDDGVGCWLEDLDDFRLCLVSDVLASDEFFSVVCGKIKVHEREKICVLVQKKIWKFRQDGAKDGEVE